jgi:hypothetical protein
MLTEIKQTKKNKDSLILLVCESKKVKHIEVESRTAVTIGW